MPSSAEGLFSDLGEAAVALFSLAFGVWVEDMGKLNATFKIDLGLDGVESEPVDWPLGRVDPTLDV